MSISCLVIGLKREVSTFVSGKLLPYRPFLRLRLSFETCSPLDAGQRWVFLLIELHHWVCDHGQQQDGKCNIKFNLQTDEGAVGKGDDEAQ